MLLRPEAPADVTAITHVIERAFTNAQYSSHTEQHIVQALRAAKALTVSLVAEQDHQVIGHVAFSPVTISSGSQHWYGLGPLAVEPAFQSQGIGAALVRAGLAQLHAVSAAGCVVLGEPEYYGRFGYRAIPGLVYPGPPPEYFMAKVFTGPVPQGVVTYHAAFASEA
jgi:predicted N-acetyltransferase YhbS